jgi:hypothetical protein
MLNRRAVWIERRGLAFCSSPRPWLPWARRRAGRHIASAIAPIALFPKIEIGGRIVIVQKFGKTRVFRTKYRLEIRPLPNLSVE